MTRSQFLRGGLKSLVKLGAEVLDRQVESKARKMVIPLLRPPGAVDELSFLAKCARCHSCADVCPHHAIIRAPAKYGAAIDTPIIVPETAPCYLCDDLPCIAACPEGALLDTEQVNIGTAHVIQNKCFAWNGQVSSCDYCYDRCPLKGEAIVMESEKPRVQESACTGCGICEYYCPAPGNAIIVLPNREAEVDAS